MSRVTERQFGLSAFFPSLLPPNWAGEVAGAPSRPRCGRGFLNPLRLGVLSLPCTQIITE